MQTINHHIAGQGRAGGSEQVIVDPATGQEIGRVGLGTTVEADAAVDAALEAFPAWADLSLTRRQRVLFDYRSILLERRHDLATTISREHGKTVEDALGEIDRGIEVVEYACGLPNLLKGEHSSQVSTGIDLHSARHPLGVCVGITPFNFPAMVPMWMFPVSIAVGNTFVLKPSERDPSAAQLLVSWFEEAGLPPGVLNVVNGGKEVVTRLLEHPDVAAASFVGSTPIARFVYETGTAHGKRVQALGGAKNHMVVMPDADLDAAADAAVSAGFGSAGQRCMAVAVIVAVGDVAEQLLPRIEKRVRSLRVGPGSQDVDLGPMITAVARDRAIELLEDAVDRGAELVADGRELAEREGFFLGPCVLDHVTRDMPVYTEEVFGPVLAVVRTGTLSDALALIAANPYGNGTAIFTDSGAAAREFERRVDAGMIGVNVPIPVPLAFYSFGGWGDSLFGSHHIYGPEGVQFYTRGKVVTSRWPEPNTSILEMGFSPAR